MCSKLFAFICSVDSDDPDHVPSEIIYHHTQKDAVLMASKTGQCVDYAHDMSEHTIHPPEHYIKCERAKYLDGRNHKETPHILQLTIDTIEIFRDAGFNAWDAPICNDCGLCSFDIDKYHVCWGCEECLECTKAEICTSCHLCSDCGHNDIDSESYQDWQDICSRERND